MKISLLLTLLASSIPAFAEVPSVDASSPEALNGVANSVTVYVYPPRNPIDWRTPERALQSIVGNIIGLELSMNSFVHFVNSFGEAGSISSNYKSSMGHTLTHVRCSLSDGELVDRWASFSGEDYLEEDKQLLLKDKAGLGALFHSYIDGHIIAGVENVKRIAYYKGDSEHGERNRPRYLQFEVDAAHCLAMKRMVEYFESYHFAPGTPFATLAKRAPEDTLYFTNMIDPYESYQQRLKTGKGLVGGGCAPFGAAMLKVAGRFRSEFDDLWRTPVTVSERLIGNEVDERTQKIRRVSLNDLLYSPLGKQWTYDGYANRSLNMYDPQKIWNFAGNMIACANEQPCADSEGALFGSELGRIRGGVTQVFRDSLTRMEGRDQAGRPGTVTESVEQPVQGFVWRLR